jgi:hypothetical protein
MKDNIERLRQQAIEATEEKKRKTAQDAQKAREESKVKVVGELDL